MKKCVILHLIDALNTGGAQELLALMARFTSKEYAVVVVVLQPVDDLRRRIESAGAKVFVLGRPRPSIVHPLGMLRYVSGSVRDILRICRLEHVDILHCHLSDAEFLGLLAARFKPGLRVLVTSHTPLAVPKGRAAVDPRNALRHLVSKILFQRAESIIAVSSETAKALPEALAVRPDKVRVILNGVDVDSLEHHAPSPGLADALGMGEKNVIALCTGRLTEQKGHDVLIQALPLVNQKLDTLAVLLAGDGEWAGMLQDLAKRCGVAGQVRFLGARNDIADLLAFSHIFVFPSRWEGTSLALMEAMAAGKPIVATAVAGNLELLKHNHNALLVPPDDPKALAEAIIALVQDKTLAQKLGREALVTARSEFDIRTMMRKYTELWQRPTMGTS